MANDTAAKLGAATRKLCRDLADLRFATPVTHVYNPLVYARRPFNTYQRRFGTGPKRVVLLGMNPGPFGMAQTGVPFGAIENVRDWLGIEEKVGRPADEHPKRPILGFDCPRQEVSGTRLWGAIADHFGSPERFFRHHFISNYCPLIFLESSGRNRTPDKLPQHERDTLFAACDVHLRRIVDILQASWVVGIGAFAEQRASQALAGRGVQIGRILHPSPANPRAHRDWGGSARKELAAMGLCTPASASTRSRSNTKRAK